MAVKKKNRILVLAMTAVVTIFIAGGAYAGLNRYDEVYKDVKMYFSSADTNEVFYNQATRTTINYEVEEKSENKTEKTPPRVTKEEFDSINNAIKGFMTLKKVSLSKIMSLNRMMWEIL